MLTNSIEYQMRSLTIARLMSKFTFEIEQQKKTTTNKREMK